MYNISEYLFEKLHVNKDVKNIERKVDDPTTWQKGDILVTTGGYNMILVDFYEITAATGKSFKLKKLKDKIVSGNGMQGECIPDEGHYDTREPEQTVRINKYNSVKVGGTYGHYARLWDGKPEHFDHMD